VGFFLERVERLHKIESDAALKPGAHRLGCLVRQGRRERRPRPQNVFEVRMVTVISNVRLGVRFA
jgi:hypothetical protein